MPVRVKCLHALLAQSLVMGPGRPTPLAIWYWNASKTNSIRPSAAARWTIDQQMSQPRTVHSYALRDTKEKAMSKESVTVAGIDCGTNSIRLKIARVDADGMHEVVPAHPACDPSRPGCGQDPSFCRRSVGTRLCGRSGIRRCDCRTSHRPACVSLPPLQLVTRKTVRSSRMRSNVSSACAPKVIPGTEEADLSFLGATSVVKSRRSARPLSGG